MAYEKQEWYDEPIETTPISAERLGHIENGIYEADKQSNRAILLNEQLEETVGELSEKVISTDLRLEAVDNQLYIKEQGDIFDVTVDNFEFDTYGNSIKFMDGNGQYYNTVNNCKQTIAQYLSLERELTNKPKTVVFSYFMTNPTYAKAGVEYVLGDINQTILQIENNFIDTSIAWQRWARIDDDVYIAFFDLIKPSGTKFQSYLVYATINVTTKTVYISEFSMGDTAKFHFESTKVEAVKDRTIQNSNDISALEQINKQSEAYLVGENYVSTDYNTAIGNLHLRRYVNTSIVNWSGRGKVGKYHFNTGSTTISPYISLNQFPIKVSYKGDWYDTHPIKSDVGIWEDDSNGSGAYKILWQRIIHLDNRDVIYMMYSYNDTNFYISAVTVSNGTIYDEIPITQGTYDSFSAKYDGEFIQQLQMRENGTYTLKAVKTDAGVEYRWVLDN